jgi:hypothetical protein
MSPSQERLAQIQAHLANKGHIMIVTYTKATIYNHKHLHLFSATETDLVVQRGKHTECLNFTTIRFSK